MRLDQPETLGAGHCLHPSFDGEFHKDVFDVRFDRFRCNAEVACDLLVGLAVANQLENAALAGAERSCRHRGQAWRACGMVEFLPAPSQAFDVGQEFPGVAGAVRIFLKS
jgi:hypothetical protein